MLKEMLGKEGVCFSVGKEEAEEFLLFAKSNGCKWIDGKAIEEGDYCGRFMGISKDLKLGYMSAMCWVKAENSVKKIKFSELRRGL